MDIMKKFIVLSIICLVASIGLQAQNNKNVVKNLPVNPTQPEVLFETVTIGINEVKLENAVKIFPNPAVNELNITLQNGYELNFCELVVYDLSGRMVLNEKNPAFKNGTYTLNVRGLEDGIYTLTLRTKNNKSSVNNKFIIRK